MTQTNVSRHATHKSPSLYIKLTEFGNRSALTVATATTKNPKPLIELILFDHWFREILKRKLREG